MQVDSLLGGRYLPGPELGSGGMAHVYLATDTALDREVAVKVLRDQYGADPVYRERFSREAKAAGRLEHPNIVKVLDSGWQDGSPYIVMELVRGASLREALERNGPLTVNETIDIGAQIAGALDCAHRNGILHRDVKPENILVETPDGELPKQPGKLRALLTDFGIATADEDESLTTSNTILGSVGYLAPERATGHSATVASDIYGLGIVLFECLAGHRPFEGDGPVATMMAHANDPVPPLRSINPAVPPGLEHAVQRALAKEPADRFQNAAQMASELNALRRVARVGTSAYAPVRRQTGPVGAEPASHDAPRKGFAVLLLSLAIAALLALLLVGATAAVVSSRLRGLGPTQVPAAPVAAATPVPAVVNVPQIHGMNADDARNALTSAGLVVKDGAAEYNASVPANIAIRTNPDADTSVPAGSTVELILSRGPLPAPPPGGDDRGGPPNRGNGNGNSNGNRGNGRR
jgi:serine/threonine-protein kinase